MVIGLVLLLIAIVMNRRALIKWLRASDGGPSTQMTGGAGGPGHNAGGGGAVAGPGGYAGGGKGGGGYSLWRQVGPEALRTGEPVADVIKRWGLTPESRWP